MRSRNRALTWIEVLMVIAVLMLAAAVLLPRLARPARHPSTRIRCVNNLKQLGICYAVWAGDNNDKLPMEVSTSDGGTKEFIESLETFRHFQVMSNEIGSPRILVCPMDGERNCATNFTSDFDNTRISYFVGVDATQTNATLFLSGDRNLTNGLPVTRGLLSLTTNRPAGWTGEMHANAGNIGFTDFSVMQLTTSGLRSALERTGLTTNRLAMP